LNYPVIGLRTTTSFGGLVFGWLFWTFGLERAMLAHFFADVILYTLLPIIEMQNGEIARTLSIVGVILVVLLAFVWAWRTLVAEQRRQATSMEWKGV
jgi:uncharacterized membrane protein